MGGLFLIGGAILYAGVMKTIWVYVSKNGLFSYIPMVPLVSVCLLLWRRKEIAAQAEFSFSGGLGVVGFAGTFYFLGKILYPHADPFEGMWMMGLSLVMFIWGGFITIYGLKSFRAVLFPLGFLLFGIPLPKAILDPVILALQQGSTEVVNGLFRLSMIPFWREETVFHLPRFTIEVASQCSGIRSSLVLVMVTCLSGYLVLRKNSMRLILVLSIFPIAVLKNGIRVVTISILAMHVSEEFFYGWLHRSGGVVFFLLALAMTVPVLWALKKMEEREATWRKAEVERAREK